MKEKYYKVRKDYAARAGLNETLRQEVDEDYLMLSEKDIKMISLTMEERLSLLGGTEIIEEEIEQEDPIEEVKVEQENEE